MRPKNLNALRHSKQKLTNAPNLRLPIDAYFVEKGREIYTDEFLIQMLDRRNYAPLFNPHSAYRLYVPSYAGLKIGIWNVEEDLSETMAEHLKGGLR